MTALFKGTTRNGSSVLLRSYDSRKEPPPEFNCTIWQAGRATSATGLAFKPIQIGQHVFIDEGPGTYNPAPQVLDEATVNEWPGREVGVFISVGTGKRPPGTNSQQHEWWEDFFGDALGTFAEARRRLISKIEGCEDIHLQMIRDYLPKRNVSKDNYYRLNVEVGVGEFGMNEWSRLADISTNTRRYLIRPEVKKSILDAGVKFAKIERMHRRMATRGGAGNDLSDDEIVPSPSVPSISVPPPSNPIAVELPAELPAELPPSRPTHGPPPVPSNVQMSPVTPDDALPPHPTLQEAMRPSSGHLSGSDAVSYRHSHEYDYSRPNSQQHSSPRRSTEHAHDGMPPPVPPKTPIPYPDNPSEVGGISMPVPPMPVTYDSIPNGKTRPPYPVDEPPPLVNRQRKPSYHVR